MGARTKQGVSQLFVHCKVNCFDVTYRNVINCFTKRITKSSNENVFCHIVYSRNTEIGVIPLVTFI